jgi:hypothetical protein
MAGLGTSDHSYVRRQAQYKDRVCQCPADFAGVPGIVIHKARLRVVLTMNY